MAYVYCHRRPDESIFYIGKGTGNRYKHTYKRNDHWHNIAKKGWSFEIMMDDLPDYEAFELEEFLISEIGLDNLSNKDEGGRGRSSGYTSHHKGKSYSKCRDLSIQYEIPIRTLYNWKSGKCKPKTGTKRWEAYLKLLRIN